MIEFLWGLVAGVAIAVIITYIEEHEGDYL